MSDIQYLGEELLSEIQIHNKLDDESQTSFSVNFIVHYIDRIKLTSEYNDEAIEIVLRDNPRVTYESSTLHPYDPKNKITLNDLDFYIQLGLNIDQELLLSPDILDKLKNYVKENPVPTSLAVTINLITVSKVPIYESNIEALKRVKVEDMEFKDCEEECCSICLDNLGDEKDVMVTCMPCKHAFHDGCIITWLNTIKTTPCCPFCRFDLEKHVFLIMSNYQQWECIVVD